MKIKELKTSLAVSFAGSERFHFMANPSHIFPEGLELEYCDKPEGVFVRNHKAEIWINLANISFMRFDRSLKTETPPTITSEIVSHGTIVRKRGRPAKSNGFETSVE